MEFNSERLTRIKKKESDKEKKKWKKENGSEK